MDRAPTWSTWPEGVTRPAASAPSAPPEDRAERRQVTRYERSGALQCAALRDGASAPNVALMSG